MAEALDPIAIVRALEERRMPFVVVGHLAEVANGSPLGFDDVEMTFPVRDEVVERLRAAVDGMGGEVGPLDRLSELGEGASVAVETAHGRLALTPIPPGTSGWDDVRRKAE